MFAHNHGDAPKDETDAALSAVADDSATQELAERIEALQCSHYSNAQVLSALIQVLVSAHVHRHTDDDGNICEPCLNRGITELLRSIRKESDDFVKFVKSDIARGGEDGHSH